MERVIELAKDLKKDLKENQESLLIFGTRPFGLGQNKVGFYISVCKDIGFNDLKDAIVSAAENDNVLKELILKSASQLALKELEPLLKEKEKLHQN